MAEKEFADVSSGTRCGIVVLNDKWEVLALERIDKDALEKTGTKKGTGQWQMPQGGLDEGEEPDEAWLRELGKKSTSLLMG